MASSFEANNNQGFLHDSSDFDKEYTLRFMPSKLRRSMSHGAICLRNPFKEQDEDEQLIAEEKDNLNTTNQALNNNHIYADLDLKEEKQEDNKTLDPMPAVSIIQTDSLSPIKLEDKRIFEKQVVIEINRVDDDKNEEKKENLETIETTLIVKKDPEIQEVMQNSIDAHLDKIDELNRTLDNRLKRNITPQITDLDAIETAEIVDVLQRGIQANDTGNKRYSTSSSDKEIQVHNTTTNASDKQQKKRSLSFSQKSINAILCNIKEFSKSPLTKMHITSHDRDKDIINSDNTSDINCFSIHNNSSSHKQLNNDNKSMDTNKSQPPAAAAAPTPIGSKSNQNTIENTTNTTITPTITSTEEVTQTLLTNTATASATAKNILHSLETNTNTTIATNHSTANINPSKDTHIITSKLKFKVPKIQKKSKTIRQTFRTKLLHFQLRKGKLCKTCTKRRRIHPSKSVFDFAKEFHNGSNDAPLTHDDGEEFCTCPLDYPTHNHHNHHHQVVTNKRINISSSHLTNCFDDEDDDDGETSDDVLSMKDHCYCVPSLAMSVSKSIDLLNKQNTNEGELLIFFLRHSYFFISYSLFLSFCLYFFIICLYNLKHTLVT